MELTNSFGALTAYSRAPKPTAYVPKIAGGKISLALSIHCCPNFIFLVSFARPASLYCEEHVYT